MTDAFARSNLRQPEGEITKFTTRAEDNRISRHPERSEESAI